MSDIELYYEEYGNGTPLILLHGNGESHEYFREQIQYFRNFRHVYALDTRGHGKSPIGTKPFTISQFADDLYDFFISESIPSAEILGYSDGGNIALIFAIRHPEMVKKLVLNGANLFPHGVKIFYQIPIEIAYFWEKAKHKISNTPVTHSFLSLMVKEPHIVPAELNRLIIPTLVIVGKNDVIKPSHTKLIVANIPGSQLEIIPGGHDCASKNSAEFNRIVGDFLKSFCEVTNED